MGEDQASVVGGRGILFLEFGSWPGAKRALGVEECPRNRGSKSWTERRLETEFGGWDCSGVSVSLCMCVDVCVRFQRWREQW